MKYLPVAFFITGKRLLSRLFWFFLVILHPHSIQSTIFFKKLLSLRVFSYEFLEILQKKKKKKLKIRKSGDLQESESGELM